MRRRDKIRCSVEWVVFLNAAEGRGQLTRWRPGPRSSRGRGWRGYWRGCWRQNFAETGTTFAGGRLSSSHCGCGAIFKLLYRLVATMVKIWSPRRPSHSQDGLACHVTWRLVFQIVTLATCPRLAVPVSATSRDNVGVTTSDHWWPLVTTAPTHCRCSGSAAHQGAALSCAGRHTADSRKGHTFTTTMDEEQPQIKLISGLLMSNTCCILWSGDTWWEYEHTQAPVLVCWRQCCDTGDTLSRAETLSGVTETQVLSFLTSMYIYILHTTDSVKLPINEDLWFSQL